MAVRHSRFRSLGARVLAISTDSVESHAVFTRTSPSGRLINFPLLSDRTGQISAAYGVLDPWRGTAQHATVFIDPDGYVQSILIYPRTVGRNLDEVLRVLMALQFHWRTGLQVPAQWRPGDPGIPRDVRLAGRI